MRILVSPAAMKGSLSAFDFANAIEEGLIASGLTNIVKLPIADGGDDTANVLAQSYDARFIKCAVHDPLGRIVESGFYFNEQGIAIIEMAAASGLRLLAKDEYTALNATSFGTGELILSALNHGAKKILLGVGGSASVDAGMGALLALGYRFFNGNRFVETGTGAHIGEVISIDASLVDSRLSQVDILILSDVHTPLLGPKGAAAVFAPQKGATPEEVSVLQKNLSLFTGVLYQTSGKNVAAIHGGGAAGGIAASFHALLDAKIVNGSEFILEQCGFFETAATCDVIITGEGMLDDSSFCGKATGAVINFGTKIDVPVVVICGSAKTTDKRNSLFVVSLVDDVVSEFEAMNNSYKNVLIKSMQVAQVLKAKHE